jgi:hypothetical protein
LYLPIGGYLVPLVLRVPVEIDASLGKMETIKHFTVVGGAL